MLSNLTAIAYLLASICFIISLRGLASPSSARRGNIFGIVGMILAVGTTLLNPIITSYIWILSAVVLGGGIGTFIALRIQMTAMPQLVAAFHSLVGMAAVLVAAAALSNPIAFGIADQNNGIKLASAIEMSLGAAIGAITFSGSVVAFLKLQGIMSGNPIQFFGQHLLNLFLGIIIIVAMVIFSVNSDPNLFIFLTLVSFLIGMLLIIPIGGADMPVVISMLNSYSGWAAAGIGYTLENSALIVTGALVGSSGAILSYIKVRAVRSGSSEDAAFLMENARSVIIVPGYGLAVAQAQHVLAEMAEKLKDKGIRVRYAIHPVAGRMPGHMNVLLAEANVPYEDVLELEEINPDFADTDVAIVIGANDVTNPAARSDPNSPIYGMPVLDIDKAETILFVKRSLSPGYAGIDNELFYAENTMMLLLMPRIWRL